MLDKDGIAQMKRENRALELRHQHGMTFENIARELGYMHPAAAQKAYKRALKRVEVLDADDYFKADLERLDAMTETYWLPAVQGNMKAADMILRIMQKRAEYLGLDAPKKVQAEVMNYDGVRSLDAEVIQLARVIDYIEGATNNITTLPDGESEGEPDRVESPSPQGATSA
jgi:hypothetical protein